ncbi:MAG: tetratricopeptide repeat protein [Verrucomicrobia bacterium]|nr:tetratricopeptide repeat protein [Verrucomicrobiota bacterium]
MSIKSVSHQPAKETPPVELVNAVVVDDIIKKYKSGISRSEIIAEAEKFMNTLCEFGEYDPFLARDGLCRLLDVEIEEVQTQALQKLRTFFNIFSYLAYDVVKEQAKHLVKLEEQFSHFLLSPAQLSTSRLLLPLLYSYKDILERLWLLPYLTEDRGVYARIVEKHGPSMASHVDACLRIYAKEGDQDEEVQLTLQNMQEMLQRILQCSTELQQKIAELKEDLQTDIIPGLVGDLCREVGDTQLAIDHYQENLIVVDMVRRENPDSSERLEKLEYNLFMYLAETYRSTGDLQSAIEYCKKVLQKAESLKDEKRQLESYAVLGDMHAVLKECDKALEYQNKRLAIAEKMHSELEIGRANGGLGISYDFQGNYVKAIECHMKHLEIAERLKEPKDQETAHGNLGNAYHSQGDYKKAIEHHQESLKFATDLKDLRGQMSANANLGNAHHAQGDNRQAVTYHEESLRLARLLKDLRGEGSAYGNLGMDHNSLGEYAKAIEYHQKHRKITQRLRDRAAEAEACRNLANAHRNLGNLEQALKCADEQLEIAMRYHLRSEEAMAYGLSATILLQLNHFEIAIQQFHKQIDIAKDFEDRDALEAAYNGLGIAFYAQGKCREAITHYSSALELAEKLNDVTGKAGILSNLGFAHEDLNQLDMAEKRFRESIEVYSELQHQLGDSNQWRITLFEGQVKTYMGLERVLDKQKKLEEALQITDARHARALLAVLSGKRSTSTPLPSIFLSAKDMQALAKNLNTCFVAYSISSLAEDRGDLRVWVVPPEGQGEIKQINIPKESLSDDMRDATKMLEKFPFIRDSRGASEYPTLDVLKEMQNLYRGEANVPRGSIDRFKNRLSEWYKALIKPIESFLPKDKILTIIPDGFLSQIPFAALKNDKGEYLIESHPISMAPSMKVLQLLSSSNKDLSQAHCLVGNPKISDPKFEDLPLSAVEIQKVKDILKTKTEDILSLGEATVLHTIEKMQKARWIHLACHGLASKTLDRYSVFEGVFKLAKDARHPDGNLYSQEIASLKLKSELVFLSACFSGTGKIQNEGSIGAVWSFHTAGVLSVIASHWRVPESALTIQMVEEFYCSALGKNKEGKEIERVNKAEALRRAMMKGIEKERDNPHRWGCFFLSGAIE